MCPCGVSFSRLNGLSGRSDARIRLPSGEWISGMIFCELRTVPWLSAFRIIQDDQESVRLQIVPKSSFGQGELEALVAQASRFMQGKLTVIPEVLDKLEPDKAGKLRAVICKLPIETYTNS